MLNQETRDVFDWPLFLCVTSIAAIGVVNLYSATSAVHSGRSDIYILQFYWLTIGAVCAIGASLIDYRVFERYAWVIYGVGIALLCLVFLLGREVRGSQRWIPIGKFALQPSELIKIVLVIALAKYLHNDPKTEGRTLRDLIVPGLIVALPIFLILIQPDLGTALLLVAIFGSIMMLTNLHWRSLLTLTAVFVASAPVTWTYLLKDYQKERLLAFMDPQADVLDSGWHAYQSTIAIGSGGFWGKGFMRGTQNQFRFLPDAPTDFPFPVWAEEQGFVGTLVLLGLYTFFILWGLKIAAQAKDRFGAVLVVGVSAIVFWQTIINLGMVSGMLPVVGVTLPLFSYGGSSVITTMVGVGLMMNVSMRRQRV
ncbi:MAG: rod shape-determining protein RodA [Myxococcales bacterium]|nr:MAG: rod shape-determining protein RodA [Myxococcales bacterium]